MYSQCPQCQAVFSVVEAQLSAYHGLVRCGRCQAVFDAVANEIPRDQAPCEPAAGSAQADAFDEGPGPLLDGAMGPEPAGAVGAGHGAEPAEPLPAPDETGEGHGRAPETVAAESAPEITEEILIDAPAAAGAPLGESQAPSAATGAEAMEAAPATAEEAPTAAAQAQAIADEDPGPGPPGSGPVESPEAAAGIEVAAPRTPLESLYRAGTLRMAELMQRWSFKSATLSLLVGLLLLLLVWQGKTFYFDALAQKPALRPYLEHICRPLGCALPPRRDFARIGLAGTGIDVNPKVPGALEIRATLINRAPFPQPYPPLRVTLSDSEGRIVGRRTYPAARYLDGAAPALLPVGEPRDVVINLAQPPQRAVGYEVELVAPAAGASG